MASTKMGTSYGRSGFKQSMFSEQKDNARSGLFESKGFSEVNSPQNPFRELPGHIKRLTLFSAEKAGQEPNENRGRFDNRDAEYDRYLQNSGYHQKV